MKQRLFAPGPVELPPQVLAALAGQVEHHRTAAFQQLFAETAARLAEVLQLPGEHVLILPGSGTAGMEAAFLATVPRGARVLVINAGKFGERWLRLAQAYGADVVEMRCEWGSAADPEALAALLREQGPVAAVLATHSETSTGVLHDIEALARAARQADPDALFLVDAVTSAAAAELTPLEWELDGVIAGSQKALLAPPGLAYVWLSERAWAQRDGLHPSFYLDIRAERKRQMSGDSLTTPATSLVRAQHVALGLLLEEGIENVWRRRESLNQLLLDGAEKLGFRRFAGRVSPAVAALEMPDGHGSQKLVKHLAGRGITITGGQDHVKDRIIRPSLLGHQDELDAALLLQALADGLAAIKG